MKTIARLFLLFALTPLGFAADEARESQEDDVREAVFRWQFGHNASGQKTNAHAYFLAIGEKGVDPTDAFMKRFAGHTPPVRKVSAASASAGRMVFDKETGETGLIFRVMSIKWKSDTEVDVTGGYYESGFSAAVNTYTVRKEEGKWKVTRDKRDWLS